MPQAPPPPPPPPTAGFHVPRVPVAGTTATAAASSQPSDPSHSSTNPVSSAAAAETLTPALASEFVRFNLEHWYELLAGHTPATSLCPISPSVAERMLAAHSASRVLSNARVRDLSAPLGDVEKALWDNAEFMAGIQSRLDEFSGGGGGGAGRGEGGATPSQRPPLRTEQSVHTLSTVPQQTQDKHKQSMDTTPHAPGSCSMIPIESGV